MTETTGARPQPTVPAPDQEAMAAARERLGAAAKPLGSLGRLEDLAVWLCGVQGRCPPVGPDRVSVVVFAGDHGVTEPGRPPVSAYPREITAAMVRAFGTGGTAMTVLADLHGARIRVCDLGVDADLHDLPGHVTAYKIRRGSGAVDREDALTHEQVLAALDAGRSIADEEIERGTDLLVPGDMGIGNTTIAATLVGAVLGGSTTQVVGRGTGIDEDRLATKTTIIAQALARAERHRDDAVALLRTVGSADLAAMTGFLVQSARRRTPVLLDGVVSGACALLARQLAPGAEAWWCAGHRSTEPAHHQALEGIGLVPVIDLGMRLGEATGALTAFPLLQAAGRLCRDMASLDELTQSVAGP